MFIVRIVTTVHEVIVEGKQELPKLTAIATKEFVHEQNADNYFMQLETIIKTLVCL